MYELHDLMFLAKSLKFLCDYFNAQQYVQFANNSTRTFSKLAQTRISIHSHAKAPPCKGYPAIQELQYFSSVYR